MTRTSANIRHIHIFTGLILLLFGSLRCTLTPVAPQAQSIVEVPGAEPLDQAAANELTVEAATGEPDRNRLFELQPNPEFAPGEVVKIQLEALRNNDTEDRGIATTYRFASPGNKRFTGPLDRFTLMIKTGYSLMLNYERAKYDEVQIKENEAVQRVRLVSEDGLVVVYKFVLSKQTDESCPGCWMTDSVIVESVTRLDQNQI